MAEHQERQLPGSNLIATPTNNTTRQDMFLDVQRDAAVNTIATNEDGLARKNRIQINGSWAEVMVDLSSLCQALGLSFNNLFENVIYHGYVHSETLGPDVEDTDYGAPAAPQVEQDRIDSPRTPSPEVLINESEILVMQF